MKKFILLIFVIYFPLNAFAVSNTDIYTQQNISGTFLESGYADIKLQKNAKFRYRILDNENYEIDKFGGVTAKPGYTPVIGDVFTVEVSYRNRAGYVSSTIKKFTVKI